jgi:hypothetical protein
MDTTELHMQAYIKRKMPDIERQFVLKTRAGADPATLVGLISNGKKGDGAAAPPKMAAVAPLTLAQSLTAGMRKVGEPSYTAIAEQLDKPPENVLLVLLFFSGRIVLTGYPYNRLGGGGAA